MTTPIAAWKQAVDAAWTSLAAGAPPGPPGDRNRQVQHALDRARSMIGTKYAWGGGNRNGPTMGQHDNGGDADAHGDFTHTGFDCSGLMEYAYGDTPGSTVMRNAANEYQNGGEHVPWAQREPGDLLFYANKPDGIHHVALYTGKNAQGQDMMVEAEESGTTVHEVPVRVNGELMKTVTRPVR